jgi:hypothetical protein
MVSAHLSRVKTNQETFIRQFFYFEPNDGMILQMKMMAVRGN